jgi:hypothetical protein
LFNFKNVRKDIEKALLGEVEYDNDWFEQQDKNCT